MHYQGSYGATLDYAEYLVALQRRILLIHHQSTMVGSSPKTLFLIFNLVLEQLFKNSIYQLSANGFLC